MNEETEYNKNYIKLDFPSNRVGRQYYTIDGANEVTSPSYCKYVYGFNELTEPEKEFIFQDYLRLKAIISKSINDLSELL